MSNGDVRQVSLQDIQLVQNLIERCFQLYMSQAEVVNTLLHQAKIEPGFTELVWQKLEAENQEFFRAYHLRLMVKEQILRFNQLLERQVSLMRQMSQPEVISLLYSDGSPIHPMHDDTTQRAPQHFAPSTGPENTHQQVTHSISNGFTNGLTLVQQPVQAADMAPMGNGRSIDVPANMGRVQGPAEDSMRGLNGGPPLMFGAGNNLLESHNPIGDSSSSFNGRESSSHALNEILENGASSFGILAPMSRNFSLSDLTADFSNSADILENYSRSPFLLRDENFTDRRVGEEQQGVRRMDSGPEDFSYDDFASN